MLRYYAYSAPTARDARDDARVRRRPDGLEVGRRAWRDALLRSPRARRDENGTECRQAVGRFAKLLIATFFPLQRREFGHEFGSAERPALSRLGDLETCGRRQHREHRRCRGRQHSSGACATGRAQLVLVPGRSLSRERGCKRDGILPGGSPSRSALPHCRRERLARRASAGKRNGEILGAPDIDRKSAGRTGFAPAAETPTWRRGKQTACQTTLLRGTQRRAFAHRSSDEPTGQTGAEAQDAEEALSAAARANSSHTFRGPSAFLVAPAPVSR